MEIINLWNKRVNYFWLSIMPHFRYIIQSGFLLFIVVGSIVFSVFYARWLEQLPVDFHGEWMIALVLIPVIAISPVRTFLQRADLVYMLPMEMKFKSYFRKSLIYSFMIQAIAAFVLILAVWPLYGRTAGDQTEPFVLILLFVLILKGVNLYGSWREKQFAIPSTSRSYAYLRWGWSAALTFLGFLFPLWKIAIVSLLVLFIYVLSLRLPAQYVVNWELLVKLEQHALSRWYSFISWFVDIPEQSAKIHKHRIITWFADRRPIRQPFQQKNAYRYLYLKTLVRTDLLTIVYRLALLGIIVIAVVENELVKSIVYLLFLYVCGVQLSALKQLHRYTFWVHIYPLPESQREASAVFIIYRSHLIVVSVLFIPFVLMIIPQLGELPPLLLLCLFPAGIFLSYLQNYGLLKRKKR